MWSLVCVTFIMALTLAEAGAGVVPLPARVQAVIGVLTQPPGADMDGRNFSLVDSSYVSWLEAAGAIVVPILFNQTQADTRAQFFKLSGVLFTGGPDKPTDFDRYWSSLSTLYDLSMEYGQPLWGTCLGFQAISDLAAGGVDILGDFNSVESELPLVFTPAATNSRMFGQAPSDVLTALTANNFTTNWHHYGVSPQTFSKYVEPAGFRALSVNVDLDGLPFVASIEHASQPIYATQWHPEANAYDRDHATVNHEPAAVHAMQYMANFFVAEARQKGLGPGSVAGVSDTNRVENYPLKRDMAKWDDTPYAFNFVFE